MEFFTKSELNDFSKIAGTKYKVNNEASQLARAAIYPIFEKTEKWAEDAVSQLPNFKKEGKKNWNISDTFRNYSWFRIYKVGDEGSEIFFTVGVDSGSSKTLNSSKEAFLILKLDCRRSGNNSLSTNKVNEFDKLIDKEIGSTKDKPFIISTEELGDYNWEKLISLTVSFLKKYEHVYNKALQIVKEKRVARLCWNTRDWVEPSGNEGKSENPVLHEKIHGYGYEEWLFDYSKSIDDYQYGFLEPVRQQQESYEGKKYDVWLYTLDNNTKDRFWIGWIYDLEVLKPKEALQIDERLFNSVVKDEMKKQVVDVDGIPNDDSKWKDVNIVNVRFKKRNVLYNDPPIVLDENHPVYKSSYYSFVKFTKNYENGIVDLREIDKQNQEQYNPEPKKKRKFDQSERKIEVEYVHDKIRYHLVNYLNQIHGSKRVFPEEKAGYGSNKVDITVNSNGHKILYEIKTANSYRKCIREALGQILEYNFWVNENRADKLIIVTEPMQGLDNAKNYVSHLRKSLGLEIYLQTFDLEAKELSEEY